MRGFLFADMRSSFGQKKKQGDFLPQGLPPLRSEASGLNPSSIS